MQNLITAEQMHKVDEYTIQNKPIASIDLMEQAARAFAQIFMQHEPNRDSEIAIFCGKGNNGGDGLAIAHLLTSYGYQNINIYLVTFSKKETADFAINKQRIKESSLKIIQVSQPSDFLPIAAEILIDAILGSGLNKPLSGKYADLSQIINAQHKKVYAVDVPTGFFSEGPLNLEFNGIKAYKTISFQRPKINFFFPESIVATEEFEVVNIGLDEAFIHKLESDFILMEESDIRNLLHPRKRFTHKGTYGHALIVAGNVNTMGAALLASSACLHSGAGLTTACIPQSGLIALNSILPEVMALTRDGYMEIERLESYKAIAIGPGLGISEENEMLLEQLIIRSNCPLVIDADALNILAQRQDLLDKLPQNTIITPHMKEFDRLFGEHENWWTRVQKAKIEAQTRKLVIVLKNQYTFVCVPDGKIYINPSGNPAMAQGGMGDILTGILAAFVAQGYPTKESALLACYVHGKAGDELADLSFVVPAGEIAHQLPKTIKSLSF